MVEDALVAALRSGHLAGAVLDVFETEPLAPGHPLWSMPNVIVSPHIGGDEVGTPMAFTRVFLENLERYMAGQTLRNVVDKRLGMCPRPRNLASPRSTGHPATPIRVARWLKWRVSRALPSRPDKSPLGPRACRSAERGGGHGPATGGTGARRDSLAACCGCLTGCHPPRSRPDRGRSRPARDAWPPRRLGERRRHRRHRGHRGGLAIITAAMLASATSFSVRTVRLDAGIMAFTAFGTLATGVLAWIRFRETGRPHSLFHSAAFAVMFASCLLFIAGYVSDQRVDPQASFYVCTLATSAASILLAVGLYRHLQRRPAPAFEPHLFVIVPAVAVLGASMVLTVAPDLLPPLVDRQLAADPAAVAFSPARLDVVAALLQVPAILAFAGAAFGYAVLFRRLHRRPHAVLAAALVMATASQVHFALLPVYVPGVLTSAEVLRSIFLFLVLVSATQAWRQDLRSLRRAYEEQVRGQQAEVRRATIEERARLAREIDDKLVQSLWVAKLRMGHLMEMDLPTRARELSTTVVRALDDGLAELREAIVVLTPGPDGPILLDRLVDRSIDRLGGDLDLDIRFTASGTFRPLSLRVEAELLTILREALTNTAKHADASVVRVHLVSGEDGLVMEVADNGVGFDPAAVDHGLGLQSMRERAQSIGARLAIRAEPMDGTTITIQLLYAAADQLS